MADRSALQEGKEHGEQLAAFINSIRRELDPEFGRPLESEPSFVVALAQSYIGAIMQTQVHAQTLHGDPEAVKAQKDMAERMERNQEEHIRLMKINIQGGMDANGIAAARLEVERAKLAKEST